MQLNNRPTVMHHPNELLFKTLNIVQNKLAPSHCFVAKYDAANSQVTTVCYLEHGKYSDNFSYELTGSPCSELLDIAENCCYVQQVQEQFPEGLVLKDKGAQAYLGSLLRCEDNKVLGLLVCMFDREMDNWQSHLQWVADYSDFIGRICWFQQVNNRIQQLENRLEEVERISNIGTWGYDFLSDHYWGSDEIYRIFDIDPASQTLAFGHLEQFMSQDDVKVYQETLTAIKKGEIDSYEIIHHVKLNSGHKKYLLEKAVVQSKGTANSHYIEGKTQDITQLYQLNTHKKLQDFVFEHTSDAVMITNKFNRIIFVNNAMLKVTGYSRAELIDQDPNILSSSEHRPQFYQDMWQTLNTTDHWRGEVNNRRKNGETYPEELSINIVRDEEGEISNYVAIFRDISQWKKREEKLQFYAQYEALTGLINRRTFLERLNKHLERAENDSQIAILFIDLDDFKLVNDIYGHEIGDLLLKKVAQRLSASLSDKHLLCRYGGDEFTILLSDTDLIKTQQLVNKILQSFENFITINEHVIDATVSIGVEISAAAKGSAKLLLRHANYAMRHAKKNGRNCFSYHDVHLQKKYQRKLELKEQLKSALHEHKLEVYYQPIVDIKRNRVAKLEALIRWPDGLGNFISPAEFIPIAEEYGLMHKIGEFVCKTACQDIQKLHQLGYDYLCISINRSIKEFVREDLGENSIAAIVAAAGIPYHCIIVEITESVAMSENFYAKQALAELRSKGIKIALDDFCTGYSSLNYLIDYDIDIIKIDRSFINQIEQEQKHKILTTTVLQLAEKLKLEVVAEGVERDAQLAFLKENNCQFIQGYYFSPALPIAECISFLDKGLLNNG